MDGRVLQVNISPGGVPKLPVEKAWVGPLGLDGDAHRHRFVHGGPHRAVALLGIEAIERVQADGHPIEPGSVGENLTTTGIELSRLPVGTRLAIGDRLVLELSARGRPVRRHQGRVPRRQVRPDLDPDPPVGLADVRPGPRRGRGPDRRRDRGPAAGRRLGRRRPSSCSTCSTPSTARPGSRCGGPRPRPATTSGSGSTAMPRPPRRRTSRGASSTGPSACARCRSRSRSVLDLFRDAGTAGWFIEGGRGRRAARGDGGRRGRGPRAATSSRFGRPASTGSSIRPVGPSEASDWVEVFIAGFEVEQPLADAWRAFQPILAEGRGYHQFLGELDGRVVAASALMTHRRVGWLGAGDRPARGAGPRHPAGADRPPRRRGGRSSAARRSWRRRRLGSVSAANLTASGMPLIWRRQHYRLDPSDCRIRRTTTSSTRSPTRAGPTDERPAPGRAVRGRRRGRAGHPHPPGRPQRVQRLADRRAALRRSPASPARARRSSGRSSSPATGRRSAPAPTSTGCGPRWPSTSRATSRTRWRWPRCSRRSTPARCR